MTQSANDARPLHVLLPTLGSSGDVHPVIALGLALRARGHRATILTNPLFRPLIEQQGLNFLPVGTIKDAEEAIADPNLWHPRKGFAVVARIMISAIAEIYRLIERHADAQTVIAASGLALGARVAQEKLGIPMASVHLQPAIIRSLVDQGVVGNVRISRSQPMWLKRAFFRLVDWVAIDSHLKRPLNEFRATLGLPPVHRVLYRWVHSPQCVIGLFPAWFAQPQADWPPHTHLVGFSLWDAGTGLAPIPSEVEDFLCAGDAPLIFTAGSAASTRQRYFRESVDAARLLGMRALLITNFREQLPGNLPRGVQACGYLPFSEVLPRASLLVYHGGIGTLAQAINAGIPQLVVPNGHDQFDNGWRIEQLGLGRCIAQSRYRAAPAADEIRAILEDRAMRQRSRDYNGRIDSASALTRACELIEELVPVRVAAARSANGPAARSQYSRER